MGKKFRVIWVSEPAHDFSKLRKYCDEIKFLTTGYENLEDVKLSIRESLEEFDIDKDAIICAGKNTTNFVLGKLIGVMYETEKITIGLYVKTQKGRDYIFMEVA